MRKQTFCICKNKGADQLRSYAKWTEQFLYFLNPKFPVSSHLLCLYSSFCVGPVQKPHCWFSHHAACSLKSSQSIMYFPTLQCNYSQLHYCDTRLTISKIFTRCQQCFGLVPYRTKPENQWSCKLLFNQFLMLSKCVICQT